MKVPEYASRIARIGRKIVTLHYYFNLITAAGDWMEKHGSSPEQRERMIRERKESTSAYFHETDPEQS